MQTFHRPLVIFLSKPFHAHYTYNFFFLHFTKLLLHYTALIFIYIFINLLHDFFYGVIKIPIPIKTQTCAVRLQAKSSISTKAHGRESESALRRRLRRRLRIDDHRRAPAKRAALRFPRENGICYKQLLYFVLHLARVIAKLAANSLSRRSLHTKSKEIKFSTRRSHCAIL